MPTVAMASMETLAKWPREASDVEKPPVAMVVMEWTMASKPSMPAHQ